MQKPEIAVDRVGETLWIVGLTGEHDLATAPRLEEALAGIVAHGTEIVVDLSAATFVDSTIVGVLVRYSESPQETLALIAPRGKTPRRVIDLIAGDTVAQVFESRQAALDAMGA